MATLRQWDDMIEARAHRVRVAQAFIDLLMTDAAHPAVALEDFDIPELFNTGRTEPSSAPMPLCPFLLITALVEPC